MADTQTNGRTFKPVNTGGNIEFIKPSALSEAGTTGLILEAIYLGPVQSALDPSKNDYKFEKENGDIVVINNCGSLANQLKSVEAGTVVQISYNGKQKIKSGKMAGKEAHSFSVAAEVLA